MRVLFNTYPVAFDCPGGGEIQLLKYREALTRLGVDVSLFDLWRPQFGAVDLVHYFSLQGGSMSFCHYVKQIGLPLVISTSLWLTDENRPKMPLGEIRDLLHLADRILPNSQAEAGQLSTEFGVEPSRFAVIPNGVDARFACREAAAFRDHFGVRGDFLLNVANIEPRKNQILLARVAHELGFNLVLLGRARDRACLDQVLDAGGAHVRHLGHLDHEDPLLRGAYAACRVFALPSLLETPGLAALEAAAQGAKIVITSVGPTDEYFGPHASYFDPSSASSLREAIDAQWRAAPSQQLRERVLSMFTWENAASNLIEAYEQTLLAGSAVR